jgi:poly-gamma-glutamate system protein
MGGTGDRGMEWNEYEQSIAADAIKRSGIPFLKARNLKDAIEKRMLFYGKPRSYVCMINVGGNQASLGGGGKLRFNRGGWFEEPLGLRGDPDGVMDRFLNLGVPCLNLLFLDDLNRREQVLKR